MSAGVSRSRRSGAGGAGSAGPRCTIRVETVFRDLDEQQAQALAAEMIDRAHELANLPDCECDLDVSVQLAPPQDDEARGAPAA
jgi:hypothetical protein